jgi:hypothetical protein
VAGVEELKARLEAKLGQSLDRPFRVHGMAEALPPETPAQSRDTLVEQVRRVADGLVRKGLARRAYLSAIAIGARCEDEDYRSSRSEFRSLEELGPEFEPLAVARRLAAHFMGHGL